MFAQLSRIYKACLGDTSLAPMTAYTTDILIKLTCFLAASRGRKSSYNFKYLSFDRVKGRFIVPCPTGVWADLDNMSQYAVIGKEQLDSVLSALSLHRIVRKSTETGILAWRNLFQATIFLLATFRFLRSRKWSGISVRDLSG